MSVTLPNGSLVHIASGLGSALTVSAATNASPCVMTSTAHGLSNGDFVEVTSGWSRAEGKLFRVSAAATNTFALEGFDTSSTTFFPAGSGTGSVKKVSGWTQLQQITDITSNGGEQQFATYQFVEADREVQIPTNKAAASLNLTVADDPSLAGYILASTANDDRTARSIRITLANASLLLYRGYVTLNKTPSLTVNQIMACAVTVSLLNEPVRYAS